MSVSQCIAGVLIMSNTPNSSLPEEAPFPDFAYALLVSTRLRAVLMCFNDGEWNLPHFIYSDSLEQGALVEVLCDDFKHWIGAKDEALFFTTPVELLGAFLKQDEQTDYEIMTKQVFLMEAHGDYRVEELSLPNNAEWKTAEFASSVLPDGPNMSAKHMFNIVRDCVEVPSMFLLSLSDPRYRLGWFQKASEFLRKTALLNGEYDSERVIQYHMNMKSTVLKLETSAGCYFLKAPMIGCNEAIITTTIARLFPEDLPAVLGTSDELHCFITEEFKHKDREGEDDLRNAVLQLGKLQIRSISHLEDLKANGCPNRDLSMLPPQMKNWLSTDSRVSQSYSLGELKPFAPAISDMCNKLAQFHIPQTLVHGDFSLGNIAHKFREGKELMLFDWEFGHIGHPFCDFHVIYGQLSDELLDEYLGLWSSFEDLARARKAYEIARRLGAMTKVWSLMEWTEKCNAQKRPFMAQWVFDLIHHVGFRLQD